MAIPLGNLPYSSAGFPTASGGYTASSGGYPLASGAFMVSGGFSADGSRQLPGSWPPPGLPLPLSLSPHSQVSRQDVPVLLATAVAGADVCAILHL